MRRSGTTLIVLLILAALVIFGAFLPSKGDNAENLPAIATSTRTFVATVTETKQPQVHVVTATPATSTYLPVIKKELDPTATEVLLPTLEPTLPVDLNDLTNVGDNIQFDAFTGKDLKTELVAFKPLLDFIVKNNPEYAPGVPLKASLAPSDAKVPLMDQLGPPCLSGESAILVGYDWLSHPLHFALDIACKLRGGREKGNDWFKVAAPTRAVVWAVIREEGAANVYNESGVTILLKAQIPDGYGIQGFLIFGYGHLDTNGVYVQPGQQVEGGQEIGEISRFGTTGNTTGPHTHYAVIWEHPGGKLEFLNPHDWHAIGKR